MQFLMWKADMRVYMAVAIGIVLVCLKGYPYLKFATFLRSDIQAFEMYIICGSTGYTFLGVFIGNLLLMSNAPFSNEISAYEMLRLGKKRWINSKILYIILGSFFYSLILIVSSIAFSAFMGTLNFRNEWSDAMNELAIKQPRYAIDVFRIMFSQKDYVYAVKPYVAVILTLVCNSIYSILLCMMMMSMNLRHNSCYGWAVASVVHILGYVLYSNAGLMFPQKYSLFCHAMPALYFNHESKFSIVGTICFSLALFFALREICLSASKNSRI